MSPRAACRLETLGFDRVFDYEAGKADWIAAGLAIEGRLATEPRTGDLARSDPPTCGASESTGEARERMEHGGWDVCVVVNEAGCVLGRLLPRDLADPETAVEAVMQSGPWTQRPHVFADVLAERMRDRKVPNTCS